MATTTNLKLMGHKGQKHISLKNPDSSSAPLAFYSLGKYEPKDLSGPPLKSYLKIMRHQAEPSIAAPMSERNPKNPDADVNVKPTLHDKFNNKLYLPGRYLNPYGCQRSRFKNMHNALEKSKNADSSIHVDHLSRAKIPYDTKKGIKC